MASWFVDTYAQMIVFGKLFQHFVTEPSLETCIAHIVIVNPDDTLNLFPLKSKFVSD
jgi:hypothetical protein